MSSDPTRIVVSEPRDVIALVPYRLGFVPRDSLAVVALRGPGSQVGLVLRVDLAEVVVGGAGAARQLAGYLVDDGARRAVAVLYDTTAHAGPPAWLARLEYVLADAGVDLVDCWQVDDRRFRSLLCAGQGCCPADGWPVTALQSATVSAEMVALGLNPARSRAERLPDLSPAPAGARRRVAARVRRTGAPQTSADRGRCLTAWLRVLADPSLADERDLALALTGLHDPLVRDAVVLTCTPDGRRPACELVLSGGGAAVPALDALFDHGTGPVPLPDRALLARAAAALAVLARHAQGERRADALAVMAWAAWWEGDGAQGLDLSDLALASRPDHSLAVLVREALRYVTPPGWVRAQRRADLEAVPGDVQPDEED
jgi:hypothetical protein